MDDQVSPALSARRATWLSLAVNDRRGGRQPTNVNLNGLLRTTSRGFEDRRAAIHYRPLASAPVQPRASRVHRCPLLAVGIHGVGCHLGCQRSQLGGSSP